MSNFNRWWSKQHYNLKDSKIVKEIARAAFLSRSPEIEALQAKIDSLMLEFCPEDMSQNQINEWAKHQKPYESQST